MLYISEIQPNKTNASAILLHRHLGALKGAYIGISEEKPSLRHSIWCRLLISLLHKTSKTLKEWFIQSVEPILVCQNIASTMRAKNPTLILALAHGRLGLHAWRVGKKLGVPTVTIFHDWWPEMMCSYRGKRDLCIRAIERDFINAQKNSDLALAVCPGMAKNLIYSKKVEVLYPIPDDSIKIRSDYSAHHPIRVVYTGSLWSPYGEMLLKLAEVLQDDTEIALKIHGDPKYIPLQKREKLLSNGILENYINVDQYKKRVTLEAEVLLAVMGGDAEGEIRMATSFPSKVANYFQTGNVVLLWALPGSSLRTFALEYDYPWLVESENASDVVLILKRLTEDHSLLHQARLDAKRIKEEVFDPLKIQRQFEAALRRAVHFHSTL